MISKWKNRFAYFFLFIILYLYNGIVTIVPGDDKIFSKASDSYSLFEWLYHRYNEWSGRLFPDTMVYLLLDEWVWVWHIINPLMMLLLAHSMIRIFKKNPLLHELIIALLVLGYFAQNVLSAGVFWITGSMNYLWPITLGLFSMIPFADRIFRDDFKMKPWLFLLHVLSGFIASVGNEQTALTISCFALLSIFSILFKREKPDIKLIIFTLLLIIGTCAQLFAPGNEVRYVKNTDFWFPGFDQLSMKDHFYLGIVWAFEKLFRDMKYIVLLLSAVILFSQYKERKPGSQVFLILFTCQFGFIIGFHILGEKLNYLYDFAAMKNYPFTESLTLIWKMPAGFFYALFPYLFWTVYSILLAYNLFKNSKHKLFTLLILLAAISTLVVIFFSPTIYGSGNRVLTIASVLLGILVMYVIVENKFINRILLITSLGCFSVLNLSFMFLNWYLNGFNSFL